MFEMMDELSELVYVVDIENDNLLFMNTSGRKMFGIETVSGHKCYEAIHGRTEPCEACNTASLDAECFITRELTNQKVHRHYLLKDRLVDWDGRPARVEIAFDITEQKHQQELLESALARETFVLDCTRLLYAKGELSSLLGRVLATIGTFMQCKRAFISEKSAEGIITTYEWCVEGLPRHPRTAHQTPKRIPERWATLFQQHSCVVLSRAELQSYPDPTEYEAMEKAEINSAVLAPLETGGRLLGYMGVDDPPPDQLKSIQLQLETLSYFVASAMERHQDKLLLENLSYRDTLTDSYNRNAYTRDTERIRDQLDHPIGVVHVDVNGMKEINEVMGHECGDRVLLTTAQRLGTIFSRDEVYRIGGDEFMVLNHGLSARQFESRVLALQAAFAPDDDFHIAIGYQWSEHSSQLAQLVADANDLLFVEKRKFYRSQVVPLRYRHENDDALGLTKPDVLRQLLDSGNFIVYFQPKFSVKERSLVGAEALVRYITPEGTLVMPDQFIPILEEARLVSAIDFYVFDQACASIASWIKNGYTPVPISVNFSRYSLPEKQFPQHLEEVWSRYSIPRELLEIEITESMDAYDDSRLFQVVDEVRQLGFSIAIDDFGVKHANISLFTAVKFDVLKIDKILSQNLVNDPIAQVVLSSISDLCRKMGIQMIVEGIETEAQFQVLQKLDCESVQGYLFDRPIPQAQFENKYMHQKNLTKQEEMNDV